MARPTGWASAEQPIELGEFAADRSAAGGHGAGADAGGRAAGPVLIDLGLVRDLPPPASRAAGRPATRSPRRTAALLGVAVAAALLTADTASADTSAVVAAPGTPVAVVGDALYLTESAGSRLSAYSLRGGRRRWTAAVPAFAEG